jgi:hypothetical protein
LFDEQFTVPLQTRHGKVEVLVVLSEHTQLDIVDDAPPGALQYATLGSVSMLCVIVRACVLIARYKCTHAHSQKPSSYEANQAYDAGVLQEALAHMTQSIVDETEQADDDAAEADDSVDVSAADSASAAGTWRVVSLPADLAQRSHELLLAAPADDAATSLASAAVEAPHRDDESLGLSNAFVAPRDGVSSRNLVARSPHDGVGAPSLQSALARRGIRLRRNDVVAVLSCALVSADCRVRRVCV